MVVATPRTEGSETGPKENEQPMEDPVMTAKAKAAAREGLLGGWNIAGELLPQPQGTIYFRYVSGLVAFWNGEVGWS
jgi:hypothetical protein